MIRRLDYLIAQNFDRAPTEPCLWWKGAWWSRSAVEELSFVCEEALVKSGFSKGSRIALILPNCPLFIASAIAAWRLGGAIAPINPQFEINALLSYLRHTDVMGAFVDKASGLGGFLTENGFPSSPALLDGSPEPFEGRRTDPDCSGDIAALFHTSGTTGSAKAVPLTHRNILDDIEASLELVGSISEDDVFLNALPNFHALGFTVAAMMPLVGGMSQVLLSSFLPAESALDAMRGAKVSVFPAVPTMISLVLGAVARGATAPSSLRLIFSGGDALSQKIAERTKSVLGLPVLEGYGLTETSPVLSFNPGDSVMKQGTCGLVLSCFEVEVRDSDGAVLPAGHEGRLWVRGSGVAESYFRMPELTAERFVDGWFDTRDIVKIDEDGYLSVISRISDIIVVGGANVYPREVEAVLTSHPAVEDAAAAGVPHSMSGEVVKAFVVLKEDAPLSARELTSYCRKNLPHYKVPRIVRFVSKIPRNPVGGVIKNELTEEK